MPDRADLPGRLPASYTAAGTASFADFLGQAAPDLLPSNRAQAAYSATGHGAAPIEAPHGTTIVAVEHADGVVMAGDRRATMGNIIATRDIEKVFPTDEHSCVGIAGTAGLAVEMVRLFQVELEHFEKLEGHVLSLEGKANRLTTLIRGNLGLAMQGLAVVPLFAGYDLLAGTGRIYGYDVTGGRNLETDYAATGSGTIFARSALKKRFRAGATEAEAIRMAVDALYDAADDDSATGGPDLTRRLYPIVYTVTVDGIRGLDTDEVEAVVQAVVADRMINPGG